MFRRYRVRPKRHAPEKQWKGEKVMLTRGRILDLVDMVLSLNYFCKENGIRTSAVIHVNNDYIRIIVTEVSTEGVTQELFTNFKDTGYTYDPEFLKAEAYMNEILSGKNKATIGQIQTGKKEGDAECGE